MLPCIPLISIVSETLEWNKNRITSTCTKLLMVNTKNANTFTGDQGRKS